MRFDAPLTPDIDLIDRYLAGELSQDATERLRAWAASRADRAALVEALRAHARRTVSPERPADLERGLHLLQVAQAPMVHTIPSPASRFVGITRGWGSGSAPRRRLWGSIGVAGVIAAAMLVLFGGGRVLARIAHPTRMPVTTYVTRNGERAEITLPDGSVARLNVSSRLQVPVDFAAGGRTLTLQGEALFQVAHHAGVPFTVIAGGATTRVLGTSFLVRRYSTDTATTVAVRDGKVSVRAENQPVPGTVLAVMQQATLTPRGVVHVRAVDPAQFTFASGVLTLEGVPLAQAIPELDRWYDADIQLGDSAVSHHVLAATFATGSLADLTEVLTLALDVRVVRNGRTLTLYSK